MERYETQIVFDKNPRSSELLRVMQEAAGADANRRGAGMDRLTPHNCTWVIVKMRLEISAMPQPGQNLRLVSWPSLSRFGMYPRHYELRDESGELLVYAKSIWAIMDMESRSLVMGDSIGFAVAEEEDERFRPVKNLQIPEGGELVTLSPKAEHIDTNGHVNNAAYLDLAEPYLPEGFKGSKLQSIALDYVHEILPHESFELRVLSEGNACFFEGRSEDKVLFRASETFAV